MINNLRYFHTHAKTDLSLSGLVLGIRNILRTLLYLRYLTLPKLLSKVPRYLGISLNFFNQIVLT